MNKNYEVLELQPPHGFLILQGKQTAIADTKSLDTNKSYLIICNGEAFGFTTLDQPAQIKVKEFDSDEWLDQHRVMPRERRQWWPDIEAFYVYRIKEWQPFENVKLYENGQLIDEPRLTSEQWQLVSKAKELPKQIIIDDDFISLTSAYTALCGDKSFYNRELKPVIDATFNKDIDVGNTDLDEDIVPVYSLALVRKPRMRVSKKNLSQKQEGEDMPFEIRQREGEYCVIKINEDETEETMACHETEQEAEAQLTALRINVEAEEGESAIHSDKPRKRKPRKKDIVAVIDEVDDVKWETDHKPEKSTFLNRLKLAAKNILDIVTLAETEEKEDILISNYGIAQKEVNGEVWHFTWSTNAFEDREKEIFSTKSLENYVLEAENKQEKGYFNLWHINEEDGNFNTDFARKEWQGVVGRFLVEAGPYLDDKKGQAAKEFFAEFPEGHPKIAPEGWGCSPEFRYLPEERAKGIYETIWITRTSTLPRMAAANIWTEAQQLARSKNMALSDDQIKAAIEVFKDEEFVNSLIAEGESKTAELESAGVAHKEIKENDEKPEPQQVNINMEELAAEVGKQFTANLQPIAEAMATMATELKELKEWKESREKADNVKAVTESPRYVFNIQRATEDDATIVTEDDGLKSQKPQEAKEGSNDPWSQMFNK